MPGLVVHTLLGGRLLDDWRERPKTAPFPVHDPDSQLAFYAGCMGPDMGMFPGGALFFSDLAHYVRSGELSRSLLEGARTDPERAFAWGWTAHVLADQMIHPLINVGAGEARGCGPLTYADDPWSHLAVEIGVDGNYYFDWRERRLSGWRSLPRSTMDYVGRVYHAVYGPAVTAEDVRNSLAAWAHWHRFSVALAGAASAKLHGHSPGFHGLAGFYRRAVSLLTGVFSRPSALHALTHPVAPSPRVAILIDKALAEFPGRYGEIQRDGLKSLPDYNLDTGAVESPATYPLAIKALARLGALPASDAQPVAT